MTALPFTTIQVFKMVCTVVLASLLLLGFNLGSVSSDSSCTVDSSNICQATCTWNGSEQIKLDISGIETFPINVTNDDKSEVFTITLCKGIKCNPEDVGTDNLYTVCLTKGDSKTNIGEAFSEIMTWTLKGINPYSFTIQYTGGDCPSAGAGCISALFTFTQTNDGESTIAYTGTDDSGLVYNFKVSGSCIGQSNCVAETPNLSGPVGLVLISLAIIGVLVYLIVGVLVMKFHKGAGGKELIPNYSFWVDLPHLIKDGCLFIISPCYKRDGSYENIK